MTKKILIYLIILICWIHTAQAQVNYVYDNLRSDMEKGVSEDFAKADVIDTTVWLARLYACERQLKTEEDYRAYTGSLARLYEAYERLDNAQGCQRCVQTMEYLANHYNDQNPFLQSKILSANTEFKKKRATQGMNIYKDAESYLENIGDQKVLAKLYLHIGIAFGRVNAYTICMKYIQKAVYIVENIIKDPKLHCETYYRTAVLYMATEEYENAKAYIKGAITICEHEHYSKMEAKCRLVYGDYLRKASHPQLYLAYGEYDKCINILTSDYIEPDYETKLILGKAYNGMAKGLLIQNQIDEALDFLGKATSISKDYASNLTDAYMTYGDYHKKMKNQDSAQYYYEKAFNNARDERNFNLWKDASIELSKIMQRKKNWEKAFKYKDIAYDCYDQITKNKNNQALASWEVRNIAENESRKQALEIEKNQDLIRQRGFTTVLAVVIAVVSLIFLIATRKLLVKKKKKNQELQEKKNELEATSRKLVEQQEELRQQAEVLSKQNLELEKLSLVARQTDNCIFITDVNGRIVWLNEAFSSHSGYSMDDYSDDEKNLEIMRTCNPEIKELMERIKISKVPITYTSKTFNKDGSEVWIQTTLSPGFDNDGNISQFIAVCSNITDLKYAQDKIAVQNKEINDSLEYAAKIQDAIQAPKQFVDYVLGDYFVVNQPKNIVSGDFHWVSFKDNKTLFALGDCTGHGIPGGFMSMIEQVMLSSVLQDIDGDFTSAMILNKLRERNIKLLHQRGRSIDSQDGMDASLFIFDRDKMMLNYAAGYSIAYILRFGQPDDATRKVAEYNNCQIVESNDNSAYLIRLRPNRFPVGGHPKDHIPFNDLFFNVNDGDIVYTSSDGFIDQFGGPNSKKFGTLNFERHILDVCRKPINDQRLHFDRIFSAWRGSNEQTDDVHIFATMLRKNF